MIKVERLNKSIDGKHILKDLSINVRKGSIYGLIGPNGCGKSTVIKHMTGVFKADSGEVLFDGEEVYENTAVKERIGYIPDDLSFFDPYTLDSAADLYRHIYRKWDDERFERMLRELSLDHKGKLRSFSKGMKKQAVIALTLSTHPDYLIMDEPIDGLDPIVRRKVWKYIIEDVAETELSVLVSSHNLREMEGICDSIGIMHEGGMRLERDLDELKSDIYKVQTAFSDDIPAKLRFPDLNIIAHERVGSIDMMIIRGDRNRAAEIIEAQDPVIFDIIPMSLEEVFIYELGGEKNDVSEILG